MQPSWVVIAKVWVQYLKVGSKIIAEVLAHFQVVPGEKVKMAGTHLVKYHYVSIKKEKSENMLSLVQLSSGVIKKKSLSVWFITWRKDQKTVAPFMTKTCQLLMEGGRKSGDASY